MFITDYVRGVYANKFTLTGYICAGGLLVQALGTKPPVENTVIAVFLDLIAATYATLTLANTQFGTETVARIQTTRDTIIRARHRLTEESTHGSQTIKEIQDVPSIKETIGAYAYADYCERVGIRSAFKEAGLEHLL